MRTHLSAVLVLASTVLGSALAQDTTAVTVSISGGPNPVLRATVPPEASGAVPFYSGTQILGVSAIRFGLAEFSIDCLPGPSIVTAIYSGYLSHPPARSNPIR